ncbi:MAG: DUF5009 domain-containing protein [Bacteroidales bacterium]|nr:DUF5009 domain-containing protein [Bacteroidales bacterium]
MKEADTTKKRLASLDVLRGLDLWFLIIVGPLLGTFLDCCGIEWGFFERQFSHVQWEGFVAWDLIMPLFMFMSGITIPFSLARFNSGQKPGKDFYIRLAKRFALLFLFGWIVQGNILNLDFRHFHPFANTLQAIAVGYVGAALMFAYLRPKGQIAVTLLLFLGYIAAFAFTGMNLDPETNIAMEVDKAVLGCHRDGVVWKADGSWSFNPWYQYTWILSSLNFIVTVMLGCFAGEIIRKGSDEATGRKALILAGTGAALMAAGLAMSPFFPIIKKIWSSSMTLYAGGLSFLLIAAVYYIVDVRKWGGEWNWAKWFGMNSIAVYVISHVLNFNSISTSLLHGLEHLTGVMYPFIIDLANSLILILIMRYMHKHRMFLKV